MAKIVYKTTPNAAYEWADVEGGDSMTHAERVAFLDEHITKHGLVPVETQFHGEAPTHKYGRYKADGAPPSALATALPTQDGDVRKLKQEKSDLEARLAQALEQLGKRREKGENLVEGDDGAADRIPSSSGPSGTDEMRVNLNTQDGVDLVGGGEEEREDMSTADRSDDNPVKRGPGRPRKG